LVSKRLSQHLTNKRSTDRGGPFARKIDEQRKPIFLYTDAFATAGDFHVPFHDERLMQQMFDESIKRGITKFVGGGDIWDCYMLSKHLKRVHLVTSFEEEGMYVKDVMRRMLEVYDDIYLAMGNHELRWLKETPNVSLVQLWKQAVPDDMTWQQFTSRVHLTLDNHIHVYIDDQDWLIVHPESYSQLPLSVATRLAIKHQCHIVSYHGHNDAHGWDKSGKYRCIDGGGLFDKYSLDYQRNANAMPEMKSGFNLIVNNEVIPFEGE